MLNSNEQKFVFLALLLALLAYPSYVAAQESSQDATQSNVAEKSDKTDATQTAKEVAEKARKTTDSKAKPKGTAADASSSEADDRDEKMKPSVYHEPPAMLAAGQSARLTASIEADWKLDETVVSLRPIGSDAEFTRYEMERSSTDNAWVAVIPGRMLQPPGVEYFIESAGEAAGEATGFASKDAPHPVAVFGETALTRERNRLDRHDGERSEFLLDLDYTSFGSRAYRDPSDGQTYATDALTDRYGVAELSYRYRTLSILYDFSFGLGVMRGQRPTYEVEGESLSVGDGRPEPGFNYGFGQTTFELHRNFSVEPRIVLGASQRGFAAGVGGLVRIGRIAGTRLEVGGEVLQDFGDLFFLRFAWDTVERVPMSLEMELGERPDPETSSNGVRLVYRAGYEFDGGFTLYGKIGYASRSTGLDAGFVGGLGVSYGF